jgi:hypothetical protein
MSAASQKLADAHDTHNGTPAGSAVTGADQVPLLYVAAHPVLPTAMQNIFAGQDTEYASLGPTFTGADQPRAAALAGDAAGPPGLRQL